ncbi:MAG: 2-isopropylmalate synthase, partial [Oscillospiraceae bacterium]|nr:2-isopropylmalate synthase [Oscillospiraceae bacterium]
YERQPYSGQLVFAAFSGSHQDAIAKGMKWRENNNCDKWNVPYLPIDPSDVGRTYETDVIRINSQSGKGGIGYLMETKFGMNIPLKMREEFGYKVKNISDHAHKELLPGDVFRIFTEEYVNISSPVTIDEIHYVQRDGIEANITLEYNGKKASITNNGNGRLDAVSNALKSYLGLKYTIETYTEHALESSSASKAVSYVAIKNEDGSLSWGTGIDTDIIMSSAKALVSAVNKSMKESRV